MDLEPFTRINPCGYKGLQITQVNDYIPGISVDIIAEQLLTILQQRIGYD